ncbi:MAG: M56 family metallopeptidase [Bacteroidales bacterium]|nr:M56 family metallopeptidase [Bacteroidales bacterium]
MIDPGYFLWVSGISLILLYPVYSLILRKETHFELSRIFLLGSLVFSLTLPWISIPDPFQIGLEKIPPLVLLDVIYVGNKGDVPETTSNPITLAGILGMIYLAGATVFTLRITVQIFRIVWLIRSGDMTILEHNGKRYRLVRTEKQTGPFSIFNFVVLPVSLSNPRHHQTIITHEVSHIRHGHTFDLILVELAGIVHWFNPAIRLYRSALREIHEYQADRQVIGSGTGLTAYQELLMEQGIGFSIPLLKNHFNQSLIKNRIIMLTKFPSNRKQAIRDLLLLPLILIVPAFIACTSSQDGQDGPDKFPEASNEENTSASVQPDEQPMKKDSVYNVVPTMPRYPGGANAMYHFIQENIRYPAQARQKGTTGTVFASFVVFRDGSIGNITLLRGIGDGCDEETIRVISLMPKWEPGKNENGEPVDVRFNLPVKFQLS